MNIQSNINQSLSVAAMLANMNPTLRSRAETREEIKQLEKGKKGIEKTSASIAESSLKPLTEKENFTDEDEKAMWTGFQDIAEQQGRRVEMSQKLLEIDPSPERYEELLAARESQKFFANMEDKVKGAILQAQEAKRKTRNFTKRMKEPVNRYGTSSGESLVQFNEGWMT